MMLALERLTREVKTSEFRVLLLQVVSYRIHIPVHLSEKKKTDLIKESFSQESFISMQFQVRTLYVRIFDLNRNYYALVECHLKPCRLVVSNNAIFVLHMA